MVQGVFLEKLNGDVGTKKIIIVIMVRVVRTVTIVIIVLVVKK